MALMKQVEYARLKRVTPQYISKLVRQGKIILRDRKVDPKQADAAIKAFERTGRVIKPTRRADKQKAAKSAKQAATVKLAEPKPPRAGSNPETITHWRLQTEKYKALKAKLEHEKEHGQLLPRADVLRAQQLKNERIRSAFRNLPYSIAPTLALCKSAAETQSMLLEEIDRVLKSLAEDPFGMMASGPVAVSESAAESHNEEEVAVEVAPTSPSAGPEVPEVTA